MEVNRLASWSIAQGHMVAVPIGSDQQVTSQAQISFGAHLELDINTNTGQGTPLDYSLQLTILDELVSLADEIAKNGDEA